MLRRVTWMCIMSEEPPPAAHCLKREARVTVVRLEFVKISELAAGAQTWIPPQAFHFLS